MDLTQSQVGKALGIADRQYRFYESGAHEPGMSKLVALADYFGVSLDYLCCRTECHTEDVEKRDDHVYPQFPNRLKQLRIGKGIDIWEFANLLEIPARNYAGYEMGETMPDLPMIARFADYFDVSIDYMIGRTDDPALH